MEGFDILLIVIFAVLVLGIAAGMIRTIIGPRKADRIMGINMIGTMSTLCIAILAVFLKEPWLLDVCLVYCLISFLAGVVLAKVKISEKQNEEAENE